jgi:hypothetical protein
VWEKRVGELDVELAVRVRMAEDNRKELAALKAELAHVNDLLASAVEVNGHIGEDWLRDKEALAVRESETAALKARQCGGCAKWEGSCGYGIVFANGPGTVRPPRDFSCNRWEARP